MEIKDFFRIKKRICDKYQCSECPLGGRDCIPTLEFRNQDEVEKVAEILDEWDKANPEVTNRQKFIEVFGDGILENFAWNKFMEAWLRAEYRGNADEP